MLTPEQHNLCANTIRFLAADAVQKANSGHPGAPMGMADLATVLWTRFLRYQPQDPQWPNRDRFVLSAGHASMLLYSMLHLSGYEVSLEDLQQFRQKGSITPGHPEAGLTPGVECTTGPLGAGFSNGVGMALAARMLAARFNQQAPLVTARTFVLCSDGDLQEGVASEAASLAGHLKLGNLVALYDCNDITIGGRASVSMSENVRQRFEAYGWHTIECDGHDPEGIAAALESATSNTMQPSLVLARTTIGKGAPSKADTSDSHGAPLGADEIQAAKELVGWPAEAFHVPNEVRDVFALRAQANQEEYDAWQEAFRTWARQNPDAAQLWDAHWERTIPEDLLDALVEAVGEKADATRNLSGAVLQKIAELVPALVGGSADLEPSNKTLLKSAESIRPASVSDLTLPDPAFAGRNIHFGIREHGMGGIVNGMALFGGWLPYCGTFEVFSDYMRPTLRLASLSHLPSVFVFTHDSIGVGEDGPTHQPIEQHWALRLIPGLEVWRPADGLETAAAWACMLEQEGSQTHPSAILLTRQKTAILNRSNGFDPYEVASGGYIVRNYGDDPEVILISTGSEGGITQEACERLSQEGLAVRHVSMPCLERFEKQSLDYQLGVLPPSAYLVVVEAGVTRPWYQYADHVIGIDEFGMSAPGDELFAHYELTTDRIVEDVLALLEEQPLDDEQSDA